MHENEPDWRAGGHYARLSDGLTHWRREGPPDGIPIVLVHGATVPSWEFDALVPPLLRAGFQTLRFDLYGHGASDRPAGAYTFERFSRQVIEIIEATDFPRPALLLGHSFGAALVAAVAAARPDLAARLVLVAPMLDFNSSSGWAKVFRYPVIGEFAMHFIGVPGADSPPAPALRGHRPATSHVAIHRAGFVRRLRARTVVDVPDRRARRSERALFGAALGRRDVLVVTGDHDVIIPAEHLARVRSLLPPHSHCPVAGEHNLLLTHPDDRRGRAGQLGQVQDG